MVPKIVALLEKYFYFYMSLLIVVVVVYGFSHTVNQNLIHPALARPLVLYMHAVIFSGWVIFFVLQSGLILIRNVRLHRQIGWFGAGLGLAIPILGISTAVIMTRFNTTYLHVAHAEADFIVQLFDMIAFSIFFALAIYWRKRPEYHRRLVLIASCGLTSAAFGRFPPQVIPSTFFYAGVDFLIFLGVARDYIVNRSVHRVYVFGLSCLIVGQIFVMYIDIHRLPSWLRIVHLTLS